MSVFKRGNIYHYDFWYRSTRYRGSTEQYEREDAAQVERDLQTKLRREAKGIATFDPKASPLISTFVAVHTAQKRKKLKRIDVLERTLHVALGFWGRRPPKASAVEGGVYHNLRMVDPIIDPAWLDRFEDWMAARGIEGSTKNSYISAMSGVYKTAMRPRYRLRTGVDRNPFADMERHQTNVRIVNATVEDLRAWIAAAAPHLVLALVVGALAHKLRMEQVLALRFDTHLDRALTRIVFADHKTRRFGGPQTTAIAKDLRLVLEAVRNARPGVPHVITFRGRPITSLRTAASGAAKKAKLKYGMADGGLTFHALRQIATTEIARAGVSELLAARAAGHKTSSTTRKHYVHLVPADEVAVVEVLADRLQLKELALKAVGTIVGTARKRKTASPRQRSTTTERRSAITKSATR